MTFEIKLCESTDIAITIFNMFRLNTVNMVEPHVSDEMDHTAIQYSPSPAENIAPCSGLYDVHQRLFDATCKKIVVHDVVLHTDGRCEHRQVDFKLEVHFIEMNFTVWVDRVCLEVDRSGDRRSGWTRWRFKRAELIHDNVPGAEDYCFVISHRDDESLKPENNNNYPKGAIFELTSQQKWLFGSMVCTQSKK